MKRHGGIVLAFGLIGLAGFVGCAQGDKVDPIGYIAGNLPADAGAGEDAAKSTKAKAKLPDEAPSPSQGDDDDDDEGVSGSSSGSAADAGKDASSSSSSTGGAASSSSSSSTGGTTSSSSSTGGVSSSSSSTSSSSGSTPPPSGPVACTTATVCTSSGNSYDAGDIWGDVDDTPRTITGYNSHWIRVWLDEYSGSSQDLKLRATLTSPPGQDFDLYMHTQNSGSGCSTAESKSEKEAGLDDVAFVSYTDYWGGSDAGWVLIEVRAKAATMCDTNVKWSLKLEGNRP